MSHRTHTPAGVPLAMSCSTEHGSCVSTAPGHAVGAIQERVVAATPSKWVDGIVAAVTSAGQISIIGLDGTTTQVWHHGDLTAIVFAGDPVAAHSLYGVLAVGDRRFSVVTV